MRPLGILITRRTSTEKALATTTSKGTLFWPLALLCTKSETDPFLPTSLLPSWSCFQVHECWHDDEKIDYLLMEDLSVDIQLWFMLSDNRKGIGMVSLLQFLLPYICSNVYELWSHRSKLKILQGLLVLFLSLLASFFLRKKALKCPSSILLFRPPS